MRNILTTIILLFVLYCHSHSADTIAFAAEPSCSTLYRIALREEFGANYDESVRQAIMRNMGVVGKDFIKGMLLPLGRSGANIILYPIVGPVHVTNEVRQIVKKEGAKNLWKVPFRITRKDGGAILGIATVAYLDGKITISQVDFDRETNEFKSELGSGIYVYAGMFPRDNVLASVPEFEFRQKYAPFPNTYFIRAYDLSDLLGKLSRIKNQHGALSGLVIAAHGAPGTMDTSGAPLERDINELKSIKGLFKENGKILLNSCGVGEGEIGESFTRQIGQFFLNGGGTVYSSRVMLKSDLFTAWPAGHGVPDTIAKTLGWAANGIISANPLNLYYNAANRGMEASLKTLIPGQRVRETKIPSKQDTLPTNR